MSLDPPTYLASLQNNIRQRPIPWDGQVRAGTLTEDQLARIKAVERAKKDARREIVEGDLDGYRILFVSEEGKPSVLELASKRTEVVQYILVLLKDLLDGVPSLPKALFKNGDPYKHFLPLLAHSSSPEDPIPLLTSTVLASLMASSRDESAATVKKALPHLYSYLSSLTKNSDAGLQDIGVLEYSSLLYGSVSRQQFWAQRSETVEPLIHILKTACGVANGDSSASLWSGTTGVSKGLDGSLGGGVGLQLLYHVLLVMWQLSFEAEEVGDELNDEYDIIPLYTQLLRLSPKEKTTRLLVSTLYNLLRTNQKTLLPQAVLVRLPALLQNLSTRQFTDPDLQEELAALKDMLEEYTKTKTTFDEYVAEVQSGHLRWSPPHRSTVFWAENARKIIDYENGEVLKKLAEIMSKPWDNDKAVLAIACNDVGALVKEVPEKRGTLEKLGLKTRVMQLMAEADENVRWESLRALGGWLKYSFENNDK
ncbi:ARM repeat-containing protein [Cryphonectria parasitica EP155]|uniref:V-type proton ATPase subunit H n=1 Tax=Cryphonectria parasitica (strain ATCC 38755 / EP155) TaxID=660469 RepID=A0A9P5CTH9_CRYP1|nr:ARM repeat-containing protein [Cryphonectria parasitica EP155]KAF3769175.1 ARM repeat-containing protein [Cryphonectria parasitica EP155]